jgi:hypothetical protein
MVATLERATQIIVADVKTWSELLPALGIKPD